MASPARQRPAEGRRTPPNPKHMGASRALPRPEEASGRGRIQKIKTNKRNVLPLLFSRPSFLTNSRCCLPTQRAAALASTRTRLHRRLSPALAFSCRAGTEPQGRAVGGKLPLVEVIRPQSAPIQVGNRTLDPGKLAAPKASVPSPNPPCLQDLKFITNSALHSRHLEPLLSDFRVLRSRLRCLNVLGLGIFI